MNAYLIRIVLSSTLRRVKAKLRLVVTWVEMKNRASSERNIENYFCGILHPTHYSVNRAHPGQRGLRASHADNVKTNFLGTREFRAMCNSHVIGCRLEKRDSLRDGSKRKSDPPHEPSESPFDPARETSAKQSFCRRRSCQLSPSSKTRERPSKTL